MFSDNAPLLMIILVTILVAALLANYLVHQQQERKLQRALLSKKLRIEAEKLLDALATLKQIDCPRAVIELLNQEVVAILDKISRLKPEAGMMEQLQSQTSNTAAQAESLNLENDRAMKQAHAAVRFAIRFVHQRRSSGALSSIKCDEISRELQWLDSKIEIDTHINIGKRLLETDKPAVATSHFKQAKAFIARLHHNDPNRPELMAQINDLIAEALPFGTQARQNKDSGQNKSEAGCSKRLRLFD